MYYTVDLDLIRSTEKYRRNEHDRFRRFTNWKLRRFCYARLKILESPERQSLSCPLRYRLKVEYLMVSDVFKTGANETAYQLNTLMVNISVPLMKTKNVGDRQAFEDASRAVAAAQVFMAQVEKRK